MARALRISKARLAALLRTAGVPLRPPAYLVYDEAYLSSFQDALARHSFDGRRPLRIVRRLREAGLLSPTQVLHPQLVSGADMQLVHTPDLIERIRQPEQLAELLGISVERLRQHGDPIEPFLSQTGGTIMALRVALQRRLPVFNLGGGFHHAQRDRAEGFCPVNDIAIAIECVRRDGLAQRILVIDLDYHHGNGTALIFAEDEQIFTLSVHGQPWAHIEGKTNHIDLQLPARTRDDVYLEAVRNVIEEALGRFKPDAAIYVAGADPFEHDHLGDFLISEDGMLERDLFVWDTLCARGTPFAVVLAGGYGPFAWTIPYNFIHSALLGMPLPRRQRPSNVEAQYREVKEAIKPAELRRGDYEWSQDEMEQVLRHERGGPLFMGTYTLQGIELALERYGFVELLRERGISDPLLSVDTADPQRQVLWVHFDRRDAEHLLIELVVRYRTLGRVESMPEAPHGLRMLSIEWMRMQDPRANFTLDRPQLPGQLYPGLGLARWMFELLRMMAERLKCAGLLNCPDSYHNARLYARQMHFLDPVAEGRFQALQELLDTLSRVDAAYAMQQGRVHDASTDLPVEWVPSEQLLALDAALKRYLDSTAYLECVGRARDALHLRLAGPSEQR